MKYLANLIVLILLAGCSVLTTPDPTVTPLPKPTLTPGPATYRVIKSTGLYASWDVDAKMLEALPVGTLFIPADGERFRSCKTTQEFDTSYKLCKMQVVSTGMVGWVLDKWFEIKQ